MRYVSIQPVRFMRLTPDERDRAERLLADYRARPKNANASFRSLCGAAARGARHGPPPTRNQRLGYRTAKRNRARALARALYGDPTADHPTGRS
jgi:hypothetical protein